MGPVASAGLSISRSVLENIANADHAQSPSVLGRVYFLNPATALIMHMYDDRGLDIISATREALVPLLPDLQRLGFGPVGRRHGPEFNSALDD